MAVLIVLLSPRLPPAGCGRGQVGPVTLRLRPVHGNLLLVEEEVVKLGHALDCEVSVAEEGLGSAADVGHDPRVFVVGVEDADLFN